MWAALTKASRYEAPLSVRNRDSNRLEGGEIQPMLWFSPRPSFPAEILSLSLSLSLARSGLVIECIPSKFAQGGVWEGFQQGAGARPGRGSVTSYSHRRADRWFLPCARARPMFSPNPDPNPPGLLLFETRAKKKLQFAARHSLSPRPFPDLLPSHGPHDESDTR